MLTRFLRSFRDFARKTRRNRRSSLAPRRLLAEALEDRTPLTTDLVSVAAFPMGNGNSDTSAISADGRYVAFASDASNWVAGDTNRARDVFVRDLQTNITTLVSADNNGNQGNNWSQRPTISADGRYVAFESIANNLVTGDTNGVWDVFVRDLMAGTTTRISLDSGGNQGNASSDYPMISANGRYVAYHSYATNLVADDSNRADDIFVRDLWTNTTSRVSVGSSGNQGDRTAYAPTISADGRYVAFTSWAMNLVPDDTNGALDVFVRDLQNNTTTRVSLASGGDQANSDSGHPSISADGRYVVFESYADNLVANDTNVASDVFLRDLQANTTTRVSLDSSGNPVNSSSQRPTISADGRYVAFQSYASSLVAGDTNRARDVFVRDLLTNITTRVSLGSSGNQSDGDSYSPSISADGRYVAFESDATNLSGSEWGEVFVRDRSSLLTISVSIAYPSPTVGDQYSQLPSISADGRYVAFESLANNLVHGDTDGWIDVFVRDRHANITTRVSVDSNGNQGNSSSRSPSISADGRYVAFQSWARNLVANDTNGSDDVFVRDLQTNTTVRVSVDSNGNQGNDESERPSMSADGRYVAFQSLANNLVPGDTNDDWDVFVRDLQTNTTMRVSVDSNGNQGDGWSRSPSISADGRYVAFASHASNLVADDTNGTVDVFVRDLQTNTTARVSLASTGNQGNNSSGFASISADGRYVAFDSHASNLVAADTNGASDVFVRDLRTNTTIRASLGGSTNQGNSTSGSVGFPSISADGRYVAFDSSASNLVTGDTNGTRDIFVRDLQTNTTARVSLDSSGNQGNKRSGSPSISADGRYVAFDSDASNLVDYDTNGVQDVFVVQRPVADFGDAPDSYQTLLANNGPGHVLGGGLHLGASVDADPDGQPGVEASDDTGDDGVTFTSVVRQGQTAAVRVHASQAGGRLDALLDFNADGDFADVGEKIFTSVALTAGDNELRFLVPASAAAAPTYARFRISSEGGLSIDGLASDGEVEDYRVTIGLAAPADPTPLTTDLVSVAAFPSGNGSVYTPSSISADGRYVAFASDGTNWVANDTNHSRDVFVRDVQTGTTVRVSVDSNGNQGNNWSESPSISADGRYVAFASHANNLGPGDADNALDVFVRDLQTNTTTLVSVDSDGNSLRSDCQDPAISADGQFVVFRTGGAYVYVRNLQSNTTTLASVDANGDRIQFGFERPAISADGRFLAFSTAASNLVADDTNGVGDVFVRDLQTGVTQRISVSSSGEQGNALSHAPTISADGRYVAFRSLSSNLVEGDTNGFGDIFVRDIQTNTTTRVSVSNTGIQGNGIAIDARISGDGRRVVFSADSSNLVAGDTNIATDVFVRDLQAGTTTRAGLNGDGKQVTWSFNPSISADGRWVTFESRDAAGIGELAELFLRDLAASSTIAISVAHETSHPLGDGGSWSPSASADGWFVAFVSTASNLVVGDTNSATDVFLQDLQTGLTTRVSVASDGSQGNSHSARASISGDGRYVAFKSSASDLVAGDRNWVDDVFVRDVQTNTTTRVSVDSNGNQGNGSSDSPSISADGRSVAFTSRASNLAAGDTNNVEDVFLRDVQTGTTVRVSLDSNGNQGNARSGSPWISADGRYVAFESSASNLVADDTNDAPDVFVRDLQANTTVRVSLDSNGNQGNAESLAPSISANGRYLAFTSEASNLVEGDGSFYGYRDVFVRDLHANTTVRVSVDNRGNQANGPSRTPSISADGRYVAFRSGASNLADGDVYPTDVFVRDLQARTTVRVSNAQADVPWPVSQWQWDLAPPSISADGRFVAFASDVGNLVKYDTNGTMDVFRVLRPVIIPQDFGDAPESYWTLLASTGPRHVLGTGLYLGAAVDAEGDGQPANGASKDLGDDGVAFPSSGLVQGQTATIRVQTSQSGGKLDAFLDFNADGDFFDSNEKIFDSVPLAAGDNELILAVPEGAKQGATYVRFRLSSDGGLSFAGPAEDGEVEDYRVRIGIPTAITITADSNSSVYGQRVKFTATVVSNGLPVTEGTVKLYGNGPVSLDTNGQASFSISFRSAGTHTIGALYSGAGKLLSSNALATHIVNRGRLNVIANHHTKYYDGQPFTGFTAYFTGDLGEGYLDVWGKPAFGGPATTAVEPGTYTIVPSLGTLAATNYEFTDFVNGTLTIVGIDFGDAPHSYRTLLANNGPWHVIRSGLHLGASVDVDVYGHGVVAVSDDVGDDGVTFTSVLRQGQAATVRVNASQAGGRLDAFLDFNADGDFSDMGEKIFDSVPLTAGDNELRFVIPANAESAPTYARFRLSSAGGLSFDGPAGDGEVEDYRVTIGLAASSTLRNDGRYQLDAYNVTPGGVAVFCYGTQPGPNPSPAFGVTLGLTDPVYVAQGIADPTGHARVLLALPPALAGQPVYYQAFEQGPNPQASRVNPLTAAALLALPSGGAGEAFGELAAASAASYLALDVNRDGSLTPLDVLALINFLNQQASDRVAPGAAVFPPPSYDVNGDGAVSPLDALSIINRLNASPPGAAEGEGVADPGPRLAPRAQPAANSAEPQPRPAFEVSTTSEVRGLRASLRPDARHGLTSTPLGATSRDRGLHAGAASRAAAFSEPDLPGSTLDTILPEIAEDVFRGWTRRM